MLVLMFEIDEADSNLSASADASPPAKFSFTRMLRRRVRDGVRHGGLAKTFWEMTSAAYRIMMELTPARKKTRYGDLDYDLEHSVDTTRANVNLRTQLMATLAGHPYFATEPWLFEQIMQALTSAISTQQSAVSQGKYDCVKDDRAASRQ